MSCNNNIINSNNSTTALLQRILNLLTETEAVDVPKEKPVVQFLHPNELKNNLDLSLENGKSLNDKEMEELLTKIISYSVKTSHPHFHNQLYAGVDRYSLAGSWITESLNTSQYTYEVAPVFTLVEQIVVNRVLNLIGFSNGDGIFSPGGSISNMYGIVLGRYRAIPDVKKKGNSGVKLVAFTSQDSHYSIEKGTHWLGLGTDNLIKVKTNGRGQMIPSELEKSILECINNGGVPFFVNATAGTTVLGAFDPIEKLAEVCRKYKLWLHVDACWGGSLLLSSLYRDRLKGIHLADSVSWNPHKMMGVPLQCSIFLIKEKGLLHECNCVGAKYLFQQDKFYDVSYDTGDKSIQCGRKVDAFKFWCMWKARGDSGLEQLVNNSMDCANYLKKYVTNRKGFRLVIDTFECSNICFWYIPKKLRNQTETEEWWDRIHHVAPLIKERVTKKGSLMVGYTPLSHKNLKNFFRVITTCQPTPTYDDMEYIVKEIETAGEGLS